MSCLEEVLEILPSLGIRTFHSKSGCKTYLINRFYKVEMDLKSTS